MSLDKEEQDIMDEEKRGRSDNLEQVAEHLPKLFKAMSDSLPEMITKIMRAVYSEEVGHEYGKSVAAFYKAIKESGIPEAEALALSREFIVNQQQFIKSAVGHTRGGAAGFGRPGSFESGGQAKPE
ncbi:MAG: hypothetical protein ACYC41_04180 [Bacillota bacterium]